MKEELKCKLVVSNNNDEVKAEFNLINNQMLRLIHPNTQEEIAEFKLNDQNEFVMEPINNFRWPHEAGLCLKECSDSCNGDYACFAKCAAYCATIIIG